MGNLIVGGAVLAAAAFALQRSVRNAKNGGCGCSGCSGCQSAGACPSASAEK